ncbi:MAG: cysteine desulfurase [Candidatus Aminicenantes bacterium]|nr:cysteine desulfurase [Candidatus Aminicenantes bacterium]
MKRFYFDHIAAAPLDARVLEAMMPFLAEHFGNPQSLHSFGRPARDAVEEAREKVARLVNASAAEIHFVSSGSEANNFALKGMALARRDTGRHLVVSAVEHPSVLQAAKSLERQGFQTTAVPVDREGRIDPERVAAAVTSETVLVSVMLANSEVGTIEPVEEIARFCRSRKIPVHTDAVAAAGNIPVDVRALDVDALSLAADRFYGPKGSAALYARRGTRILPLIDGGIQEGGRRAGTENVAGIVGLGRAAELAAVEFDGRAARLSALRDRLIDALPRRIERVTLTGHRTRRLPYHASFCVEFVEGEAMLLALDLKGFAVSSGSACASKTLKASHVLLAMGLDHALAQGSLVFSLVEGTTAEDVDALMEAFPPVVERLRALSPLYTQYLEEKGK